jgi:hypothetical protein
MHADDLSAYPNVVGIGTRRLDDDATEATKGTEAEHAVAVYVSRKVPAEQLDDEERLPACAGGRRRDGGHRARRHDSRTGSGFHQRMTERSGHARARSNASR